MRGSRIIAAALVGLMLSACGTKSHALESILPGTAQSKATAGVTVHLGNDPRLAPVERLLSSTKGTFNPGLFLSAFDVSSQPCNIASMANHLNGRAASPALDAADTRVVSVHSQRDQGAVELTDSEPFYVRLGRVHGQWIVDEDACLWIAEVDGGNLPAVATRGLAPLSATDPRRAPAAKLIESLTGRFDPTKFIAAFDLSDQACDVPTLARAAANQTTTGDSTPFSAQYFLRPIARDEAGVIVSSDGNALAMRIHRRNGLWFLDENACSWLEVVIGAKSRANDRAVQSDLRNGLTAEKVLYTDNQMYSSSPAAMKEIEPSLDWGHGLRVSVGDALTPGDKNVVCLSEASSTGTTWSIADVATGPRVGTYYSAEPCPAPLNPAAAARMGTSWDMSG